MISKAAKLVLISVSLTFCAFTNANVIWHLNGFTFDDGTVATGYFEWDGDINQAVSWEVSLSSTFQDSPTLYSHLVGGSSPTFSNAVFFRQPAGIYAWDFRIELAALDLLDTPASRLDLMPGVYGGDNGYMECKNCNPFRYGNNPEAFLSAVTIPEASILALLTSGLVLMTTRRRNRR